MTARLGVVFLPQFPPERLRSVAVAADQAGLDELWLWEDCFRESGIAAASAVLAWTERLTVGVGLLPVPLRNVALTAMEVATILRLFPGRAQVGVGHGVLDWMAQVGARVESPMTLLREYVTALRALLDGDTVTTDGRYVHLDGVALDWPPLAAPSLFVGATGPKSLALSGELADGTILVGGTSPDQIRVARSIVDDARDRAGRTSPHATVVYLMTATGPGCDARLDAELRRWSLDPLDGVGVSGDAAAVAVGVRRWLDAGADHVVLQPTVDEPDLEAFVRFAARDVAPLVR